MEIFNNVNTIVSIIAGLISIGMFLLSRKEKNECKQIRNTIEQKIEIFNKESSITSTDKFDIKQVGTFDNRKSIK